MPDIFDLINGLDTGAIVAHLDAETKKIDEKQKKKKTPAKKKKSLKYKAPFDIVGEFISFTVEEDAEYNDQDIAEIILKEYPALESVLMTFEKAAKVNAIKVYFKFNEMTDKSCLKYPLHIIDYDKECLAAEDYDSYCNEFWTVYPHYYGCKFHYSEEENTLIPFHESYIVGKVFDYPLSVGRPEQEIVISEQTDINKIRTMYAKQYPEFEYCTFHYIPEENLYYPIFSKEKKDLEVEYIELPIPALTGWREPLMIFDRKEPVPVLMDKENPKESTNVVPLKELIEDVKEEHPVYKRDESEILYDETGHYLFCVAYGGRKGMVQYEGSTRIEDKKFGIFRCDRKDPDIVPDFCFSDRKIPKQLLDETVQFFKETPEYEALVNIFYDVDQHKYFLYKPNVRSATRTEIIYDRNLRMEANYICAMEIHSHGHGQAYFSSIDNEDEVEARLYGVVGELHKKRPSVTFRAGIFGRFKKLAMHEIFN